MKKWLARGLLAFIIAGGFVLVAGVACWVYPPLAILGLAAAQKEYPTCSAISLYRGAKSRIGLIETKSNTQSRSRKVREEDGLELWQTPAGPFWIPAGNWHAMPTIIGQQEAGFYGDDSGRICRQGDIVLDCGAHVGTYTRRALKEGASLVVAIEPAPNNLECLRRNLSAEISAGRVVVVPKGVWDKEDLLPFFEDPKHTASDGFLDDGSSRQAGQRIPLTTVDNLAAELKLPRVSVIKMDIKGATERALKGARGTLVKYHPWIALASEEQEDDPEMLVRVVRGLADGYRVKCGICSLAAGWNVRPDVVFFYP